MFRHQFTKGKGDEVPKEEPEHAPNHYRPSVAPIAWYPTHVLHILLSKWVQKSSGVPGSGGPLGVYEIISSAHMLNLTGLLL